MWEYPNRSGGKPADKVCIFQFVGHSEHQMAEIEFVGKFCKHSANAAKQIWWKQLAINCCRWCRQLSNRLFLWRDRIEQVIEYLLHWIPLHNENNNEFASFRVLDYINIKSFDYYSSSDPFVYIHSPLYAPKNDPNRLPLTQNGTIWHWLEAGADRAKIILGLAAYGRSFQLANRFYYDLMAPADGPGPAGPYSGTDGMLTYMEVNWIRILKSHLRFQIVYYSVSHVDLWKDKR